MEEKLSIINKTRSIIPRLPFSIIKQDILGSKYSLSIAFVEPKQMQEINKIYRNKNKATNILSFCLSKNEGEILLCPSIIKNEVKIKKFDKNFGDLVGFLVIHGMLHLKGLEHSSTMEKLEEKYDQKYFSGHRLGLHDDTSRSGRVSKRRKKS